MSSLEAEIEKELEERKGKLKGSLAKLRYGVRNKNFLFETCVFISLTFFYLVKVQLLVYQLRNDSDYIIPRIHLDYIKRFQLYTFPSLWNNLPFH